MGVITVEVPQNINKTFRIKDKKAATAILRQLETQPEALLAELSSEVDRWEKEHDTSTKRSVESTNELRRRWNRN